jgi:hypothetical protein
MRARNSALRVARLCFSNPRVAASVICFIVLSLVITTLSSDSMTKKSFTVFVPYSVFPSGASAIPCCACWRRPTWARFRRGERRLLLDTCFPQQPRHHAGAFPHYQRLHDLYQMLAAQEAKAPTATFPATIFPTSSPGTTWPGPAKPNAGAIRCSPT